MGHNLGNFSHTESQLMFLGKATKSDIAAQKLTADSIADAHGSEASEAKRRVRRLFSLLCRAFCDLHTC